MDQAPAAFILGILEWHVHPGFHGRGRFRWNGNGQIDRGRLAADHRLQVLDDFLEAVAAWPAAGVRAGLHQIAE